MKKTLTILTLIIFLFGCLLSCEITDLHIHRFDDWTIIKDANCYEEGLKSRFCECGKQQTDAIATIDHNYIDGVCSYCGKRKDLLDNEKIYVRDGEYILFGEYPQTIKADNVSITDTVDSRGYYLGSDGFYYAKIKATPCTSYYTFTTGNVIDGGVIYYFKIEPIRWRILNEENGEAFLLCDSIIANHRFDENSNNYAESEIRAWLNSTFYDTAFNEFAKDLILTTEVDNSVRSTNPHDDSNYWNNGVNRHVCENTNDNVFLLSEEEVTNSSHGFEMYTSDKARVMVVTDYARAIGSQMNTAGVGWWFLRSPSYEGSQIARGVINDGQVQRISVNGPREGVVPAIKIRL